MTDKLPTPEMAAEECQTMEEVRAEIDRIDREAVRLFADRQRYIEAAARIKSERSQVKLDWRIEDVVAKVRAAAAQEGLSERIAEPVWRVLIDRSIEHELENWDRIRQADVKKLAS